MEAFAKAMYHAGMLIYFLVWIFLFFQKRPELKKIAIAIMGCALALHSVSLILYVITKNGFPMDTPNQDALIRIWGMGVLLLIVSIRNRHKLFPQSILFAIFLFSLSAIPMPLPSELWMCHHFKGAALTVSVLVYDLAILLFAYCFSLSIIYFCLPEPSDRGGPILTRGDMYNRIHASALFGLAIFVAAQIIGSFGVLAQYGTYWYWCPVHILFVSVWLFYAGMIHLKWIGDFPKKMLPACGIVGFLAILGFRLIFLI